MRIEIFLNLSGHLEMKTTGISPVEAQYILGKIICSNAEIGVKKILDDKNNLIGGIINAKKD